MNSCARSGGRATALARTLQETLIPPTPPAIPDLDVAGVYRPAGDGTEVGGDFFDVFQLGPGEWGVALGDVCGKGVDAAVVTALVRYTLRAAAMGQESPSRALAVLNDVFLSHGGDRFCTVVFLRLLLDSNKWVGTVSCAGHPLPVLRRADGTLNVAGRSGALLGAFENPDLLDTTVTLLAGDTLVMYTDG